MPSLKILMIARSTLYSSPGGDTTQIEMTAKYLRNLGVEVDIQTDIDNIKYANYGLLHFFNIIRPDDILPHILKTSIPFVVSTIFVDYLEYEQKNRKGMFGLISKVFNRNQIEYLKTIVRMVKNGDKVKTKFYLYKGHKRSVKFVAENAACLLPNSHSEYKRLRKIYNVDRQYQKVVNAIDHNIFCSKTSPNPNYSNHILCVGRIEGRKNQLNLIKAVLKTNLQLTIVGKASPNHIEYYNECIKLASTSKNIHFINHIKHEELAALYKAAKVHVLPSWFETTGLSSLEAAAMGCNVVVTNKGDTEEYFGSMAYYCDPDSVDSIRRAVIKAYTEPVNTKLQEFILDNYTWENTAEQTLRAYKEILDIK